MAQLPVANALTLELEPVVAANLARHLETADEWYAHDYVPFDQGRNFAFLGGQDWDPTQVTLPREVVDALEVMLITKDNLAGYHRELVEHFILEDKWGRWLGRWTAEENLHAIAIREYMVVTRNFDPTADEDVRLAHVMRGYRADTYTQIETLVFMALYERAHAVFLRNLEAKITELALKRLIERGAKDLLVLNRSIEKATALAERYGGRAIQFDLLDDYLPRADIVISSTSAPHCVIREVAVRRAVALRRGSPLLLIDIAVPRDIEAAVGKLENVYLYNIDDLQRVADENLTKRREAVDGAWKIVREGSAEIASMFEGADLRKMMRRLDELGRGAAESVLQKALARESMSGLPEKTREEIRNVAEKVVGKLLMGPREALKSAARNGRWDDYSRVVNDLFRFEDEHDAEHKDRQHEKGKS